MGFNRFTLVIFSRVLFISISIALVNYLYLYNVIRLQNIWILLICLTIVYQLYMLIRFVTKSNEKLVRFLTAIKHNDFILKFPSEAYLGKTFGDLNQSFNEVLTAFNKERSAKIENLQYLKMIVQHASIGLLAFDEKGVVELINDKATAFLNITESNNIQEIASQNQSLYDLLVKLPSGHNLLYKKDHDNHISIRTAQIVMGNRKIKLFSFQNIYPELQKKELESWQNLTKILRHEIMNSLTPISSLSSTMLDILNEEVVVDQEKVYLNKECSEDLMEGLTTIENRTEGLINFINAYRNYTEIPKPEPRQLDICQLVNESLILMKPEIKKSGISIIEHVTVEKIIINADPDQLKQVFINLIKNGIEAGFNKENPEITISVKRLQNLFVSIEITDNGQGIIEEAIDKIFIPFFTTKKTGSGIGLSLSRHILHLHNGTISVKSEENNFTTFSILLPTL